MSITEKVIVNATPPYYDAKALNFRNSVASLKVALETKFQNLFFKDETNRTVYSKTDFALRLRSTNQMLSNLNLPFMNFKIKVEGATRVLLHRTASIEQVPTH